MNLWKFRADSCPGSLTIAGSGAWNLLRTFRSQPLTDGCDQRCRFLANGEFVVSNGDDSMALEPVDPALDRAPLPVVILGELR
ncbi:hypothetical protein [Streptomyces buecherae]|uniref:hypothetical protein n=1 Tax=Streptomyces buecherae TaxID=2763006 RepID=UPI001C2516FB|nr:hypothetical protein [Streptomyces buecherae]